MAWAFRRPVRYGRLFYGKFCGKTVNKMAEAKRPTFGIGARILQFAVLGLLMVMTAAAAYQTWKQAKLPDVRPGLNQNETPNLGWSLLRELDLKTGVAPEALKRYDGHRVRIPGFVVPLEDKDNKVTEFLLVPYEGACIHTPPPPGNQIIQVRTADRKPVGVKVADPVWVIGELRIDKSKSPYGEVSYRIEATAVESYGEKR